MACASQKKRFMGRYGADVMDEKCSSNKNIFCVKISFVIVADAYPYYC
jgi:hypothetical protein